jgi:putative transposase
MPDPLPRARPPVSVRRSWLTPNALWARIEPLLPPHKPFPLGCHNPCVNDRRAMDAIFFRLRTGCQWNALSATGLCPSSSAHWRFQEWHAAGVFLELWRRGLTEYDTLKGIDWSWLAADGAMTKAPLGGTPAGATRRIAGNWGRSAVCWTKATAVPVALAVAGANRHDAMLLTQTLESIVVRRPRPTRRRRQGICLGNAYDITWVYRPLVDAGFTPHVRGRGEEIVQRTRGHRAAPGRGAHTQPDKPLPRGAGPVGEADGQLRALAAPRLRLHRLQARRPTGIGS